MQPHHKHDCERCVFLGQVHPHSLTGPSDVYADEGKTKYNGDLHSFRALSNGSLHNSFMTSIEKG